MRLSLCSCIVRSGDSENDITLAATTNATILGFNVRPDRKSRELADQQNVEIRTYEIIYKLLEDIEQAMVGMLEPEYEEVVTGDAEVPKSSVCRNSVRLRVVTFKTARSRVGRKCASSERHNHLEGRDHLAPSV